MNIYKTLTNGFSMMGGLELASIYDFTLIPVAEDMIYCSLKGVRLEGKLSPRDQIRLKEGWFVLDYDLKFLVNENEKTNLRQRARFLRENLIIHQIYLDGKATEEEIPSKVMRGWYSLEDAITHHHFVYHRDVYGRDLSQEETEAALRRLYADGWVYVREIGTWGNNPKFGHRAALWHPYRKMISKGNHFYQDFIPSEYL